MKWYKKLYLGESIKQAKWVQFKIAYGRKPQGYYCIVLSNQEQNLLDIYQSQFIRITDSENAKIHIVGLASSKKEAVEVVRKIIEDVYVHTHSFDIKAYLDIQM